MTQEQWETIRFSTYDAATRQIRDLVSEAVAAAIVQERDECAAAVKAVPNDWHNSEEEAAIEIFRDRFVAAIRARGQA